MDKNNIITPESIEPIVRVSSYHPSPEGTGWLNRTITDPQLLICLEGTLEFFYEKYEILKFPAQSLLFIESGREHTLRVVEDCRLCTFHFEFNNIGAWAANEYRVNPMPETIIPLGSEFEKFKNLFLLIHETFNDYKKFRKERLSSIAKIILLEAFHYWNQPTSLESNKRMQEMITYIRDNLTKEVDRNILGKLFFVTPEHINLLFKKELNCTPTDFINRERCLMASRLLDEGSTVKEAAFKSGFNDPAYFCRVFKKYMKVSPIRMKR